MAGESDAGERIEHPPHGWDELIGAFPGLWAGFDLRAERDAWVR